MPYPSLPSVSYCLVDLEALAPSVALLPAVGASVSFYVSDYDLEASDVGYVVVYNPAFQRFLLAGGASLSRGDGFEVSHSCLFRRWSHG